MRANHSHFIGRIASDPKYVQGEGKEKASRCSFRLIVNRPKTDKYDVIPCVVWGPYADTCAEYLSKGKEVAVEGEIRTNSEQDEAGNWTNFWNLNCSSVSFGRDSSKKQQESKGSSDDVDAIAAALAKKAKATSGDPISTLAARLQKQHGVSKEEALDLAKEFYASKKSTPATATDDPFGE